MRTRTLAAALAAAVMAVSAAAQVELPTSKGVYGGRITWVDAIPVPGVVDATRVFLSTESANSVFYADVSHFGAEPFDTNFSFHVIPDMSASAGLGSPRRIALHEASARVYGCFQGKGIIGATTVAGTLVTNAPVQGVPSIMIHGDHMFYTDQELGSTSNLLYFGELDAAGAFTQAASSPIGLGDTPPGAITPEPYFAVHPTNEHVYFLDPAGENLMKSLNPIDSFAAAPGFAPTALPDVATNWFDEMGRPSMALGFGPDGRIFVGGLNSSLALREKQVIYSDDDGATWSAEMGTQLGGISGKRIASTGSAASYWVYYGDAIGENKGQTWTNHVDGFPPNSPVPDPLDGNIIYFETESGLSASLDRGLHAQDISRGIEAEHITDFDMTDDMNVAWTTSRSGVRRTGDFNGDCVWSEPMDAQAGPTPSAISVVREDTSGNTVYVGAQRVSITLDGGNIWTNVLPADYNYQWQDNPSNYCFARQCFASALDTYSLNVVAVGFRSLGLFASTNKGQVFISFNAGGSWTEIGEKYLATNGLNVADLKFVRDGTNLSLYVASIYEHDGVEGGYGLYRVDINGENMTFTHDLDEKVSIGGIACASNGAVYVIGYATNYAPVVYGKEPGAAEWTEIETDGLPAELRTDHEFLAPSIVVGLDSDGDEALYATSQRNAISYFSYGSDGWQTPDAMRYPEGTAISFLYWDDLVVGTTLGLFEQRTSAPSGGSVVNDYDGDGKSDCAVFDQNTGWWYVAALTSVQSSVFSIQTSKSPNTDNRKPNTSSPAHESLNTENCTLNTGSPRVIAWEFQWGWPGAWTVSGDYDGDGKSDCAVFDSNTGWWYVIKLDGTLLAWAFQWGWPGARPVAGDYDGDGISDCAVFDQNTGWWYVRSLDGRVLAWEFQWGWPGAWPVSGDYDGDGISDCAVFDQNTGWWYVAALTSVQSSVFSIQTSKCPNTDNRKPNTSSPAHETPNTQHRSPITGSPRVIAWEFQWGWPGAWPVGGDYDGDGNSDCAVFDQNTGWWYVRSLDGTVLAWEFQWGWPGAWPVGGDYDGDGKSDCAVFDQNTGWWYVRSLDGRVLAWEFQWGWPGAWPVGAF